MSVCVCLSIGSVATLNSCWPSQGPDKWIGGVEALPPFALPDAVSTFVGECARAPCPVNCDDHGVVVAAASRDGGVRTVAEAMTSFQVWPVCGGCVAAVDTLLC